LAFCPIARPGLASQIEVIALNEMSNLRTDRSTFGFSIVEVLVAIMVVVVLTAITLPLLSRAKQSALSTDDLSNLRQLGLARQLYMESNDDQFDGDPGKLVGTGVGSYQIWISKSDSTITGWGNKFRTSLVGRFATEHPFKTSYPSLYDYNIFDDRERLMPGNRAWLFSPALAKAFGEKKDAWCGTILKLFLDGSVKTRMVGNNCNSANTVIPLDDYFNAM
jgi:type II secretory pathway pseudopilin PulG